MDHGLRFLQDLALVLIVAAVITVVFQRLRLPVVLGYILAGLIIGPYFPIPLVADLPTIQTLSELGVILLMFSLGLHLKLHKIARLASTAGVVTLIEVGVMVSLGYLAGQFLGWTKIESVFAGAMVAISSTMIISKLFEDQRVAAHQAELVYGILIFEDLIVVVMITVLTGLATGQAVSGAGLAGILARMAGFLILFLGLGFLVVPRLMRSIVRFRRSETILVTSVGLCFGSALLAHAAGFSVALGAFLAGTLVAESGASHQVADIVRPLRDMFAAIFFVAVGMLIDPGVLADHWPAILTFVSIVLVGKVSGVSIGAFLTGHGVQGSVRAGMSMAQIGEFSFIIATVGASAGAIGDQVYPIAVAVSIVTAMTSPLMLARSEAAAAFVDGHLPARLQSYAVLYGSWLEALRRGAKVDSVGRTLARLVRFLLADAAILVAITVATPFILALVPTRFAPATGLSPLVLDTAVVVVVGAVAFPFLVGLITTARKLGGNLAMAAFPRRPAGPDLGHEPRRLLLLSAEIVIVLAIGVPFVAVTLPFLPRFAGPAFLVVVLVSFGIAFWRSAKSLEGHVRATALFVVEALARQASGKEPTAVSRVREMMPGIGSLTPITIGPASPAVGRTLAEFDLRGRTGATVVALYRGEERIEFPEPQERLCAGDLLALTGSDDAIVAARRLLG